jgi:protein ImuB
MPNVAADRLACVDLPAFLLKLVLQRHPRWQNEPVAVVSKETPQGNILIASRKARQQGVFAGLSYATALGLAPTLQAATVSSADITDSKAVVMERLQKFSPKIQADSGDSATFWLSASGLGHLYSCLHTWGDKIRTALYQLGFEAVVTIGFSRFGTFALARKKSQRTLVLRSPKEEIALARSVLLTDLGLPLWITQELSRLGKNTIGDLLSLPAADMLERYGPLVYRIWNLASGALQEPLVAKEPKNPLAVTLILDEPESHALRLTFLIKRLLSKLLSEIAVRHKALLALHITLRLEGNGHVEEHVRPAQPTLEEKQLIDLVRLRLENTPLESGVVEIQIGAATVPARSQQHQLFVKRPRRNLEAAEKAFARLRAQFGPETVVHITMHPGHLPEARFSFEPLGHATHPKAIGPRRPSLVRRIWRKPLRLERCPLPRQVGQVKTRDATPSSHVKGPHVLSGGWWNRAIHREYYFVQTKKGAILWVYFDGERQQWFLHGTVE